MHKDYRLIWLLFTFAAYVVVGAMVIIMEKGAWGFMNIYRSQENYRCFLARILT